MAFRGRLPRIPHSPDPVSPDRGHAVGRLDDPRRRPPASPRNRRHRVLVAPRRRRSPARLRIDRKYPRRPRADLRDRLDRGRLRAPESSELGLVARDHRDGPLGCRVDHGPGRRDPPGAHPGVPDPGPPPLPVRVRNPPDAETYLAVHPFVAPETFSCRTPVSSEPASWAHAPCRSRWERPRSSRPGRPRTPWTSRSASWPPGAAR